jgi:hypothetical protein
MIDVLGYAAASAVLTSFLMRSIVPAGGFCSNARGNAVQALAELPNTQLASP